MDVPGLRRHALEEIRRFEEQARSSGVPNEVVLAARYALCAGLDEAVLSTPVGQSERMGAASPVGGVASRGVGRREVLRDAGPDLAGSVPLHRSDGAAVSRDGVRLRREVPGAGARARAPARESSRTSIARFAIIAARPSPGCRCGGADWRTGAIRSFGTCPGGSSPRPRCRSSPSRSRCTTPSLAQRSPTRCMPSSRRSASRTSSPATRGRAGARSDAETAPGAEEQSGALSVEEQGNRTTVTLLARGPVPVRQRDGQPGVRRDAAARDDGAEQGAGPCAGGGAHRRSTRSSSLTFQDNYELSRAARRERGDAAAAGHRQLPPD